MTYDDELLRAVARIKCEEDHLFFTRYFFKARQGIKFRVNWHHHLIADVVDDIIAGRRKNVLINVSPGSSKTEEAVINFIARGLAKNPRARFLHLSGSDSLASLNSATARDMIRSDEFQKLWPLQIAEDANAKKRWNVLVDGQPAGGVYATSTAGQVTGFRAGHMAPGFQGAILIDDPVKPEDAFSPPKMDKANRQLITTVNSRKANPETPILLIMQRVGISDPSAFILSGNLGDDWSYIKIPAILDKEYIQQLAPKYQAMIEESETDAQGRFSYWPYKEPLQQLLKMERGEGSDATGSLISRHVFNSQYQQDPVSLGGNIIKGEYFVKYKVLPKMKYRKIYADTAQKTKEANDYSVFECWGLGDDNKIYLLDMIRGKWEAPELKRRAKAFWAKHKGLDHETHGPLRAMLVEDKSSGTGLIQEIRVEGMMPIQEIKRAAGELKDKYSRVMDVLAYIEAGMVCVPESSPFTNDFIAECESFSANDMHAFDDQVDPMIDCIVDMLSNNNKLKVWERLGVNDV